MSQLNDRSLHLIIEPFCNNILKPLLSIFGFSTEIYRIVSIFFLLCFNVFPICRSKIDISARIASFKKHSINLESSFIAHICEEGFYCITPSTTTVAVVITIECYVCRCLIQDLSPADCIHSVHRQLSPNCPLVLLKTFQQSDDDADASSVVVGEKCLKVVRDIQYLFNVKFKSMIKILVELGHDEESLFFTITWNYMRQMKYPGDEVNIDLSIRDLVKQSIYFELSNAIDRLDINYVYQQFQEICHTIPHISNHSNPTEVTYSRGARAFLEGGSDNSGSGSLKLENTKLIVNRLCRVCECKVADHICLPCRHITLCEQCDKELFCPLCGKSVESRRKVYFS